MPAPHLHEIVLRGRLDRHHLGPLADDFAVDHERTGVTRLVGTVRDAAHLHGVVAYLASINAELISLTPADAGTPHTPTRIPTRIPTPPA